MTRRAMKKKSKVLKSKLMQLYAPEVTGGSHTVSIRWDKEKRVFDVKIVGKPAHYEKTFHEKEFSVGLYDKPMTMGQLFYGSRWL